MAWQQRFGGREWQVTSYGVLSRDPNDHSDEEAHRSDGQPLTVTRYLYHWGETIRRVSREEGVPVDIILATIATENGPAKIVDGAPYVRPVRKEPRYVSDEETPHQISVGPCHVLISTARAAMRDDGIDREWLKDVGNNLRAACRYLSQQDNRWKHGWDPILASASYNAGGIYEASNPESRFYNRWHVRNHVRSTGRSHVGIFADWFGDARYVLTDEIEEPEEDEDIPSAPLDLPEPELVPPTWPGLSPRPLPLPTAAMGPASPLTPHELRDILRAEGFEDDEISRIARAMERITAAAEQAVRWYHRARPVLAELLGAWRVLRG